MFPGIGDHYLQMGRGLYETIPTFREIVDECDAALRPYLNQSLTELLYPPPTEPASEAAPAAGKKKEPTPPPSDDDDDMIGGLF